ncbi:SNF2-related protein [Francisellaceae bacterium]|nr:SNF2-related protein [Francisellaceae bacterium]
MASTAKSKNKSSKSKKTDKKPFKPQGWNTTDAEEIERRKIRAETEILEVKNTNPLAPYFSTFVVNSKKEDQPRQNQYLVEMRSLSDRMNTCDCPDFQNNGLGTCKHVEGVLLHLQKMGKRKFQQTVKVGNPNIEIYLDQNNYANVIKIAYSHITEPADMLKEIDAYFSAEGELIGDPIQSFPILERSLNASNTVNGLQIRISAHIHPHIDKLTQYAKKKALKETFSTDVQLGKRSLNVVKHPLYEYQQKGMQHLAFTGRALLADEMGLGKTVQAIAACELLRQLKGVKKVLVVATASLKTEWEEQIAKFTDLPSLIVNGSRPKRLKQYQRYEPFPNTLPRISFLHGRALMTGK